MPRMNSFKDSFANINAIEKQTDYLGNYTEADWVYTGYIDSYDDSLLLQMPNGSSGAVVSSTTYLLYGKIGCTMKSARDKGVISAFITFSDVKDEIDFEFLGYNLTNPQTNFYSLGILNYTNVANSTTADTYANWHYYEIDWAEDKLAWLIDGEVIRTLNRNDTWNETTDRYDYPQTPSRIQFSLWPGGSALNALGTIEWAGGAIDWNSQDIQDYGYYYAHVKNFTVEVYDLPSVVKKLGKNDTDSYHAFVFNSTEAHEENVLLSNRKTWLGSIGATGFNPEEEEEEDKETITILSGSSTYLSTKTASTVGNDPAADATDATAKTTTTASTSEWTGGFVQNFGASASGSSDSSSGSGSGFSSNSGSLSGAGPSYHFEAVLGAVGAIAAGVFAFGI